MARTDFPVYVHCMTYNHAPYIKDALNGFVKQNTNFPFVCIIADDASSDETAEIISEYLNCLFEINDEESIKEETEDYRMCFARSKTNAKCYFAFYKLKYNHYGKKDKREYFKRWTNNSKYIAICEGDDYWKDASKLQAQYDYLEEHPECGMCFSSFDMRYGESRWFRQNLIGSKRGAFKSEYTIEQWIVEKGFVAPMTWLVRKPLWDSIPRFKTPDGTFIFFAWFLFKSKVYCMKDKSTAVYRVLKNSASHSNDINEIYIKRIKGIHETQCVLIEKYIQGTEKKDKIKKVVDEQFYKGGLRWFVALNKTDLIKEAQSFPYESRSICWNLILKLAGIKPARYLWKLIFPSVLKIRRKTVFFSEIMRAQRLDYPGF